MQIICILGKAEHGKDTVAEYIKEILEQEGKKVLIAKFGDILKYICTKFYNWNGEKDKAGRTLLQVVGDKVKEYNYFYFTAFLLDNIKMCKDGYDYVLISDARFKQEITETGVNFPETIYIKVVRPNHKSKLTEQQQQHISEIDLDDIIPNYIIMNVGCLEHLREEVENCLAKLKKESKNM